MRTIDGTAAIAADQAWARGSTAAIVTPPVAPPAPPMPPTFYPPTAEGGRPGPGGPQRRRRRWIIVAAVLITAAAAGIGGWALRGPTTPAPAPAPPAASPPQSAAALTPAQAKTQACDAFKAAGSRWASAYHDTWLPAVSTPGWTWNDPAVKEAAAKFSATESQVVSEINGLLAPNTPPDVATAIRAYTSAILAYAAGHGSASQSEMNAQESAIDAAATEANRVCNES